MGRFSRRTSEKVLYIERAPMPRRSALLVPRMRRGDKKLPPRSHGAIGAEERCRFDSLVMMVMVASRSKKKPRGARDRNLPLRDMVIIADALDLSRPRLVQ